MSEKAKLSQLYKGQIKNGSPKFGKQLAATIFDRKMNEYFSDAILIPVPRSTPIIEGALFPTKILSEILVKKGLGARVYDGLTRVNAIPKSHGAFTAGTRPTLEINLNSLSIQPQLITESNIIIVDDFLTLGRSTMAAALKVKEAFPDKNIKIFAAFRTRGNDNNIFVDVKLGSMKLNSNNMEIILPD